MHLDNHVVDQMAANLGSVISNLKHLPVDETNERAKAVLVGMVERSHLQLEKALLISELTNLINRIHDDEIPPMQVASHLDEIKDRWEPF